MHSFICYACKHVLRVCQDVFMYMCVTRAYVCVDVLFVCVCVKGKIVVCNICNSSNVGGACFHCNNVICLPGIVRGAVECANLLTNSKEHRVEAAEMFQTSLTVMFPGQVFLQRVEGCGRACKEGSVVVPQLDRRNLRRCSLM